MECQLDHHQRGLLEVAISFLKILSRQMVDKTMVAAVVKADVK